jgi:predicted porin
MNKNIKLAVAGAVLALSATANAGIIIPAGDWTLDINGNVNGFMSQTRNDKVSGTATAGATSADAGTFVNGGLAYEGQRSQAGVAQGENANRQNGITTGLLPAWLGFTGKTRQNDLDVEFTISLQPQVSDNGVTGDGAVPASSTSQFLNRQTYLSLGDKSWGSIKIGKDLGIFASDAILNDMTLLGVGSGGSRSGSGDNTTLGGIGTGYIYAAWKGQVAYTTPNFNGFQATVGVTNPNQIGNGLAGNAFNQDRLGFEGKASYSFAANDVTGKVWASGASYDVTSSLTQSYTVTVGDIGATLSAGGFSATGYYYNGKGAGATFLGVNGFNATTGQKRDSDGGYLQLTYVLPTKTKVGVSYGESNLDAVSAADRTSNLLDSNQRYTVGAYHPITKHLNLVAEYSNTESKAQNANKAESDSYSAGAILFF